MRIRITFELTDQQRRDIKQYLCEEFEGGEYDGHSKATYDECRRILENEGYMGAESRSSNVTPVAKTGD